MIAQGIQLFDQQQQFGFRLFEQNCASCHIPPFFHTALYALEKDGQKYMSPSLRNIQYSAPYMHDGSFDNLDTLLDQHSKATNTAGLYLDKTAQKAIISFLKTLSDPQFLNPNAY